MVELALAMPVLLLVLVGILQFGKAFNYWIDLTHLSSEGARWAVVDKNLGDTDGDGTVEAGEQTLQQYIACRANTGELKKNSRVYIEFPSGSGPGDPVRVRLQYQFRFLKFMTDAAGLPSVGITIHGSTTQRLERSPTRYSDTNNNAGCP